MSAPLPLHVDGDVAACDAAARRLADLAEATRATATCLARQRSGLDAGVFAGAAAGAFVAAADALTGPTAALAEHLAALALGLRDLARSLAEVETRLRVVAERGAAHGLLRDDGLVPPEDAPADSPRWECWQECRPLVSAAREIEAQAQRAWLEVLRAHAVELGVEFAPPPGRPTPPDAPAVLPHHPGGGHGSHHGPGHHPTTHGPGPSTAVRPPKLAPVPTTVPGPPDPNVIDAHTQGPDHRPHGGHLERPHIPRWVRLTFLEGIDLPERAGAAHWDRVGDELRNEVFAWFAGAVPWEELAPLSLPELVELVSRSPAQARP